MPLASMRPAKKRTSGPAAASGGRKARAADAVPLEMRPSCEKCRADLPAASEARICSHEMHLLPKLRRRDEWRVPELRWRAGGAAETSLIFPPPPCGGG